MTYLISSTDLFDTRQHSTRVSECVQRVEDTVDLIEGCYHLM